MRNNVLLFLGGIAAASLAQFATRMEWRAPANEVRADELNYERRDNRRDLRDDDRNEARRDRDDRDRDDRDRDDADWRGDRRSPREEFADRGQADDGPRARRGGRRDFGRGEDIAERGDRGPRERPRRGSRGGMQGMQRESERDSRDGDHEWAGREHSRGDVEARWSE